MSIKEGHKKINNLFNSLPVDFYIVLIIILIGFGGFGLGRLSALEENRQPVYLENRELSLISAAAAAGEAVIGRGEGPK